MAAPRTRLILLLAGPVGAGKTTLASRLVARGFRRVATRDLIVDHKPDTAVTRINLQAAGEHLDETVGGDWVAQGVATAIKDDAAVDRWVVDAVRTSQQVAAIRQAKLGDAHLIFLSAPLPILESRYFDLKREHGEREHAAAYDEVRKNATEARIDHLRDEAELVLDSGELRPDQVEAAVLAMIEGNIADGHQKG